MNGVSELFADLAGEAKVYGALEEPVRVMRRRRRILRFAPVGVAALVVVASVLTYVAVRPTPADTEDDIGDIPTGSLSWLPPTLSPPASAPALPTDRGVGPAAVVVWPQNQPDAAYVVAPSGDSYRLPDGQVFGLSPDGRWLLSEASGRLGLRDLTGSRTIDVGPSPETGVDTVWDSDRGTLAVGRVYDSPDLPAAGHTATIVDLTSGGTRTVSLARYPTTRFCGLRDSDLLLCSTEPAVGHLEVWVVDGRTGVQRSHLDADLTGALTPAELDAGRLGAPGIGPTTDVTAMPGGSAVLIQTTRYAKGAGVVIPADLLLVDVRDGRVMRRLGLPEQRTGRRVPADGGGFWFTVTVGHGVASTLDDGVLLVRWGPAGRGADALVRVVRGLELLDPATGGRTAVMTVSGPVAGILVRGAAGEG